MAISDRVVECINKYNANELDNALIQLCIALDATAKNEYPRITKVGQRFKAFIRANQDIISFFTFGTNVFIDCQFGELTIEDFIYTVLRCGLLHEGDVPKMLRFAEPGSPVAIGAAEWRLPRTFIFGTLLAVLGASSNSTQAAAGDQICVVIMGKDFRLSRLWGRVDLIREAVGLPR